MHSLPRAVRPEKRITAIAAATLVALLGTPAVPATAAPISAPVVGKALATPATPLTESQALAQAEATGAAVEVTSATTETETLTANPDGGLTLARTAMPVRRLVDRQWKDLDATLRRNTDGSISPTVASSDLTLSDGGAGPLAILSGGGHRLALSMPMSLPEPTLSGPTATYHDVLPGVDLVSTATNQGGFSEVVVVRTAAAATDPRLATLTLATQATGITLESDDVGNISGVDKLGRVVVAASAPRMWDSSTTAAATARKRAATTTNSDPDPGSSLPALSSPDGPGVHAQQATLGVQVTTSAITLTPDQTLMASPRLSYPVYLDPSFVQPVISDDYNGWSTINKLYPSTNYWDSTPDPHPEKDMQAGSSDESKFISRSLINFPVEASKIGSPGNVTKATLQINEDGAYSCNARPVDLYAPSKTLSSSNATWNDWANAALGDLVDSANVAYGYKGCGPHNIGFDVLGTVRADVKAGKTKQTFLLKAADESDRWSWKEFTHPSSSVGPTLTIDYNHAPNTPTAPKTNPASNCAGSPIGLGPVSLIATVSDPDGGTVGATFKLVNHTTGATVQTSDPKVTHATSSQAVTFALDRAKLVNSANHNATQFDWSVTATDYEATSGSAACHFTFDPNSPGRPDVTDQPNGVTIGQPASFTASPSDTVLPGAYLVQLNGAPPARYPVTDPNGKLTFSVTPTRLANTLTVTTVSTTGTNIGQPDDSIINALPSPTPAADQDLTGDGIPDLLAVGGPGTALPPGLWIGPGNHATGVGPGPADIGVLGDGLTGDGLPTDFNGTRAISGRFDPDARGLQHILVYQPQGAADNEGGGEILSGNGDGTPIDPTSNDPHTIGAGKFDYASDSAHPVAPLQLVNAGSSSGRDNPYPDLIGIGGDTVNGYHLWYYQSGFKPGVFDSPNPMLGLATPTGGSDWNTWTLASAQIAGKTDLYLWQKSTGALYLWSNLAYSNANSTLDYTQTALSTSLPGTTVNLQAADIDGNGFPDLWTLGSGGAVTAWLDNGTSLTAAPTQTLTPPTHTWLLNDAESGPATSARDVVGGDNAGGTSGNASWTTGSLYSPDATFGGQKSAMNSGTVLTGISDFTVSFWARPTAYSGNVISQDGTNGTFFKIWPSNDTSWHFGMEKTDVAFSGASWDEAKSAPGTDTLGLWYHITATFQASTKKMTLYIGNTQAGTATRTGTWGAPHESSSIKLQFGTMKTGSGSWDWFYNGQLANVQIWNAVVPPGLN